MLIIGVDYHPSFQQIAFVDTETGEFQEQKKTDREDARHILRLLLEDRLPRIWVPSWDNRDLRQLLWHRHRMVRMRTRIISQLQP